MASILQLRKGTTTQHNTFTGANAEVTVDTTKKTVVVHDGATAGGFPLAKASDLASYLLSSTAASTYLTQAGAASTYLTQANAASTYLTGITGSQVTTALGYTPVNKSGDTMTGSLAVAGLTNSGNTGLGTSSAVYRLDAVSGDNSSGVGYTIRMRGSSSQNVASLQFTDNAGSTEHGFFVGGPNNLGIIANGSRYFDVATSAIARLRVQSNGAIAIGTSLAGADATLHLQGAQGSYGRLTQISAAGTSANAFNIMSAKNSSGTDNWWTWGVRQDSTWCLIPGVDSNMSSTTGLFFGPTAIAYKPGGGTWSATSDQRIKTNIAPITGAVDRIMALKPCAFDYKAPDAHQGRVADRGFIAQDFEIVYPHSVSETEYIADEEKQFFEEGDAIKNVSLNPDFFADIVAFVQELKAANDALATRVAELEAK